MDSQIRRSIWICLVSIALGSFMQTVSGDTETNRATVERWLVLWNTGDLAIADEVLAPHFVNHDPSVPEVTHFESYMGLIGMSHIGTPDLQISIEDMIAENDRVAVRLAAVGTHSGNFMGIPPTGIQVNNTRMVVFRLADGKIVEAWENYDMLGVLQQLGVAPPTRPTFTWGEPSAVVGNPGDSAANRTSVNRMIQEAFNQGNLGVIDELFAADYVMHDPAFPMEVKGPEGFKMWAGAMLEPFFTDSDIRVCDTVAADDQVAVRWQWSGHHTGEFGGVSPTGRKISITGISIHRFADGKFVESWVSYDSLGMMEQLTIPEWSIESTWISAVPTPLGNMITSSTWTARDSEKTQYTGVFEQISSVPVLIDLYPDLDRVKFAGAWAKKTGVNQFKMTALQYFTKTSEFALDEIVGIGILTGNFKLKGSDLVQGQGMGAYYLAVQDADEDGFPDPDEEPVICLPWVWSAKRLTAMSGCNPMQFHE